MNDKDIEIAGKAYDWVKEHEFSGEDTSVQDDRKITLALLGAFIAGYQNAENDS